MSAPAVERSLAARIAAEESWAATEDRSQRTAPARAALDQKFLDQANGDPVRAAHLRRAYYGRLALASARSRRKAREARESAAVLDQVADDAEKALEHAGAGVGTEDKS